MKKKITLILLLLMSFSVTNKVKADTVYADGSGGGAAGTASSNITCQYGAFSDSTANYAGNAIRITVVDSNGNRISGTKSIDLTNKASGANLSLVTIKYTNGMPNEGTAFRMDNNPNPHSRNEIISGNVGNTYYANPEYKIYYWNKLPNFNYTGQSSGGTILRNYFINNFASSDAEDMKKIFSLMNYNGYTDKSIYGNHYLLVEPLFYIITTTPVTPSNTTNCDVKYKYYYGTGTEIFYMIKVRDSEGFWKAGSMTGLVYSLGSRVHDTESVAGLTNAHGIVSGTTHVSTDKALSKYGLSSMHVWMTDLFEKHEDYCKDVSGNTHKYSEYSNMTREEVDDKICGGCKDSSDNMIYYSKYPKMTHEQVKNTYCSNNQTNTCNNDITIKIQTECDSNTGDYTGNYSVIEDTSDWNCIYQKWNSNVNTYEGEFYSPNGDTTFKGYADSNRYCRVACRESISYNFPDSFNVLAGGRFTIGTYLEGASTMGPITMRGTTTCNTGVNQDTGNIEINVDKFVSDYQAANKEVAEAWDLYQIERAKLRSITGTHTQTLIETGIHACSDTEIDYNNCIRQGTVSCKVSGTSHNGAGWGPHDCDANRSDTDICNDHARNACGANGLADCAKNNPAFSCSVVRNSGGCVEYGRKPKTTDTCGEGNYEHDGHREWQKYEYYGTIQSYVGIYYSWTGQDHYIGSSDGKHGDVHYLTADVAGAKARYDAAVNKRNGILDDIKECSNYQRTYTEFKPEITFTYSDEYYKNDYLLTSTPYIESTTVYNNGTSKTWGNEFTSQYANSNKTYIIDYSGVYGSSASIFSWDCSIDGQQCRSGSVIYPTNRTASQTTTKMLTYTLPDNLYRYIAKNGISYNTIEEILEKNIIPGETTTELIQSKKVRELVGSSLPVSYKTGDCKDYYYIDYYNQLFGTNQKFYKYDKVTINKTSHSYKCVYNITQDFYENNIELTDIEGNTTPYSYEENVIVRICDECPECSKNKDLNIIYRPISLGDPFPGESGNTRIPGANWQGSVTDTGKSYVESYITNNRNVDTNDVYKLRPIYEFILTPTNMRRIRDYNNRQKDNYNDDYTLNCYKNGDYCQSEFLYKGIGAGYFEFTKENPNGGTCYGANLTNWDTCRYTEVGGS